MLILNRNLWLAMLLALSYFFIALPNHAFGEEQSNDWTLKIDKSGIKVYTSRITESKFRAVKATISINASVNRLVGVIQDASLCPEWADRCKESKIVETISDSEYYLYAYSDMPFPVSDRDAVMHVRWSYEPESGQAIMNGEATTGRYPKTKAVRINQAKSQWVFTPQTDGTTLVESTIHGPRGSVFSGQLSKLTYQS